MSFIFAPSRFRTVRGTTWSDSFQIVDDEGTPVDLNGITELLMRVRSSIGSATVLIELSVTNGRLTVTDPDQGMVSVLVSAVDTLGFPINSHRRARYVYDAVIDRGGAPKVIEPGLSGRITVEPQVTRLLPEPT